jgi:hypothetical protein
MIRSDEKARQMARSLLPSTRGDLASHDRARIHRTARREVRLELAEWLHRGDPDADLPPLAPWEPGKVREVVCQRRARDKVNPFIRWASARVRGLPFDAREGHVRGLLPKGLVGEHALFHLKQSPAFKPPIEEERWRRYRLDRAERMRRMDPGEQARLLRALILEPDGQRTFNHFLRERGPQNGQTPASQRPGHRPLRGLHDVLPFLASLRPERPRKSLSATWSHPTPASRWVEQFLQRFKQHHQRLAPLVAQLMAEGLLTQEPPRHERLQAGLARKFHAR